MAKVKAKTVRKERRDTINAAKFVEVYKPMAEAGKSAKEIGAALGRDETYVCVKAAMLRKAIKTQAAARKLDAEATEKALAMVPKLKTSGGSRNVLSILGIEG